MAGNASRVRKEAGGSGSDIDPETHLIWRTVQEDAGTGELVYEALLTRLEL